MRSTVWKLLYFDSTFTFACSKGSNEQQASNGSDNGLTTNRHYLNKWWLRLLIHICITWPRWVKAKYWKSQIAKACALMRINFNYFLRGGGCVSIQSWVCPRVSHLKSKKMGWSTGPQPGPAPFSLNLLPAVRRDPQRRHSTWRHWRSVSKTKHN